MEAIGTDPERIVVLIHETSPENKGRGGYTFADRPPSQAKL